MIDQCFDAGNFVGCHWPVVAKVETGFVGIDQGAFLRDMTTKYGTQGLVHEVRGRVIAHGRRTHVGVDFGADGVANFQCAVD